MPAVVPCLQQSRKIESWEDSVIQRQHRKYLNCQVSIVLHGSSSAERLSMITCQISRLQTLRAPTTEPGRDSHLRRDVHARLLYALQLRVPAKKRGRTRNRCLCAKREIDRKYARRDAVDLKSWGRRKLKRGNREHRRFSCGLERMNISEVRCR